MGYHLQLRLRAPSGRSPDFPNPKTERFRSSGPTSVTPGKLNRKGRGFAIGWPRAFRRRDLLRPMRFAGPRQNRGQRVWTGCSRGPEAFVSVRRSRHGARSWRRRAPGPSKEPSRARSIVARPNRSTRKRGKARDRRPGRAARGRGSHPGGRRRRSPWTVAARSRAAEPGRRRRPRACRRTCVASVKANAGTASAASAAGKRGRHDDRAVKGSRQGTRRQDAGDDQGLERVIEPAAGAEPPEDRRESQLAGPVSPEGRVQPSAQERILEESTRGNDHGDHSRSIRAQGGH